MDDKEKTLELARKGFNAITESAESIKSGEQTVASEMSSQLTLRELQDWNSSRPATKEFLEARGLKNVRDLDAAGKRELKEHLERTLAAELEKMKKREN